MVDRTLKDAREDNVLTMLCWDIERAPVIAKQVSAEMFSTQAYRRIAQFALDHIAKYGVPPRGHLRDYLEKEMRHRDGQFLRNIIDNMEKLHPTLQAEFVLDELDKFIANRKLMLSMDASYDALNNDDIEGARLKLWEGINAAPAVTTTLFDPWADPEPPPFDLDILPREMREISAFVRDRSKMIGADSAGLFWTALSCCSAAINGSVQLQMKEYDASFRVRPALWVLLVGDPSSGRSPIIKATWAPLKGLQTEANQRFAREAARWKAMTKEEQRDDTEPVPLEYMVDDITTEALQEIHADQDRGVAVLKDEWAALIGSMSRYGDRMAFDRTYYLESHDGGPGPGIGRGRRGRGTGYRRPTLNKLVTVCGGIQYDVLRKLDDLTHDGFLQRSNPILVPSMQIGGDEPSGASAAYETLIDYLSRCPGNRVLRLSQDALRIRVRVEIDLKQLAETTDLGSAFHTHLGKLHGQWGRLVLVLSHIMEPQAVTVSAGPAELAEHLLKQQLIPHAALLYQWLGNGASDDDRTKQCAGYILSHRAARLLVSDLTSGIAALRGKGVSAVQDAVSPLVAGGWLTPEETRHPGKPHGWAINQQVYQQFAEQAELEKFRREQTRRLLQPALQMPRNPDDPDDLRGGPLAEARPAPLAEPRVRARTHNQDYQERVVSTLFPRARNQDHQEIEGVRKAGVSNDDDEATALADSGDSGAASLAGDSAAQVPPLAGEPEAHAPTALADDSAAQQHLTSENVVPLSRAHAQSGTSGNDDPAYLRNSDGPRTWNGHAWVGMGVKARADALRRRFKDRAAGGGG